MYRVYLLPQWREFGLDYPSRERAERAADRYRASFPTRRYLVRRAARAKRRIPKKMTNPERS